MSNTEKSFGNKYVTIFIFKGRLVILSLQTLQILPPIKDTDDAHTKMFLSKLV